MLDLDAVADKVWPRPDPYTTDPVRWVHERLGEHLWSAQRTILESVRDNRYTAVHSCHDVGKSYTAARAAAWWVDAHPPGEAFVVSTAPTFTQVRAILWQEIGRAWRTGDLVGRVNQTEWWVGPEMVGYGRKPADYDPAAFQGIHARYVLVIIDEACGVPEAIWNAVDALVTNEDARVLAIGNPDDPSSHFARVCRGDSGWSVVHIDGYDSPNFTGEAVPEELRGLLLSETWVAERRERWGEESPLFQAKVRGRFPTEQTDGVIPMAWLAQAHQRWREWDEAGRPTVPMTALGVDVSRGGADATTFAHRHGQVVTHIDEMRGAETDDTMVTADRVMVALTSGHAVVDVVGIGSGVVDRLGQMLRPVVAFNAGANSGLTDSTGTLGFAKDRSAAWWNLRELLSPQSPAELAIPDDDELTAELCAPRWKLNGSGRIQVESKDEIRARLGRSTDKADAVIHAFWPIGPWDGDAVLDAEEVFGDDFAPVRISDY